MHNTNGQLYRAKQTFSRADVTQIAQGFSKRVAKLEQENFNKDWQLEKERQSAKQLIIEKEVECDRQIEFHRNQAEFEKKAMLQE